MLTQIDIGKPTTSQQTKQAIIAQLLAYPIDHSALLHTLVANASYQ